MKKIILFLILVILISGCVEKIEKPSEGLKPGEKQILPESEVKCPDGVCDDFEMKEGVCAEDCRGVEGWEEKTGQTKEVEIRGSEDVEVREEPKEESVKEELKEPLIYNNWPMFGYDAKHTGFSDSKAPNTGNPLRRYLAELPPSEGKIEKGVKWLIFNDSKLYFTFNEFVYTIDTLTGKRGWYSHLDDMTRQLAIDGGKIFVSGEKGVYALNAETGNKLWDYKVGNVVPGLVVANNKVFFGSYDYNIYALNTDGTLAWKHKVDSEIHSIPAVSDDKVCFGTENVDFSVYCLKTNTGDILWRHTFSSQEGEGGMFHAPPAISDNMVFIGEEGGKRGRRVSGVPITPAPSNFYALDINTGETVWSYKASDWIVTAPAIGYGKVYFSTWDGNLYAINMTDGQLVWKSQGSSPIVADGKVFVTSTDNIFAYNADKGNLVWGYSSKEKIKEGASIIILGNGKIYTNFESEEKIIEFS